MKSRSLVRTAARARLNASCALAISLQRRDPLLEQIVHLGDAVVDERMEAPQLGANLPSLAFRRYQTRIERSRAIGGFGMRLRV
jgi:hypothetical protein